MAPSHSIKLIASNDGVYAEISKPIPRLVQWSFLAFVAALAMEGWPLEADVTLPKLFGVMFFACYMAHTGLPLRLSLPPIPGALWGFLAYFLVYSLTGLALEEEGIRAYVTRLMQLLQFFALFWFASDLLRDPEFAKKALLTFAFACSALALGAFAGVPGLTADDSQGRNVTSLEFGPNTLAVLMACAAIIIIGYCIRERAWSAKRKAFLLAMTLPLFAVIVQTGSRAGIACFLIGMGVFLFPHRGTKKQKLTFLLSAGAIVGVAALLLRDPMALERWTRTIEEGDTTRSYIYTAALDMFIERPLLGWGGREAFNELGYRLGMTGRRDAHNFVLYLLIEVGLIGTIPFLSAIGLCLLSAFRSRGGPIGLIPLSLVLIMLAYGMSHTAIPLKAFWLILGLAIAASAGGREVSYHRVKAITNERKPQGDRAGLREPSSIAFHP